MLRWTVRSGLISGLLLASCALLTADSALAAKPKLKGRIDKGVYTSGAKLFRAGIPSSRNWAGVPFSVSDISETKGDRHDMVLFDVNDFGERLTACARPMPPEIAARYGNRDSVPMDPLARAALREWSHLPKELTLLSDSTLTTPDGAAALIVYRAPKGSLVSQSTGGGAPERFDAIVTVAATVRKGVFLYAIGQNDMGNMSQDEAVNIASLRQAVGAFFGTLALVE